MPLSETGHAAFAFVVFAATLAVMGTYLFFRVRVAPVALRRWADGEGLQILSRADAGPIETLMFARGSGHQVYRVTARDKAGRKRAALVRVGVPLWFCLSPDRCPVEIRWDAPPPEPFPPASPPREHPLWDRDVD